MRDDFSSIEVAISLACENSEPDSLFTHLADRAWGARVSGEITWGEWGRLMTRINIIKEESKADRYEERECGR